MAKKIVQHVEYSDDLDGLEVAEGDIETIAFSYKGVSYEIDLKTSNATKFDNAIRKYIDHARKVKPGTRAGGATRKSSGSGRSTAELAVIRQWLIDNGHEVKPRGRIKTELLDVYDAAH
ncbi:Lsr2 family protein [Tsukamurella tyrosinosolvens]|uniref:histone-like nucleoid-structuring protein Lsr2 n=1 Tax=Tsukamurella tyrosinosolvens TaxID=57704 RepID=UPI001CE12B3A|nr:Lsr2 family protein [Tsukamurella tyrosinosolvens]MCA4995091.1 Lsr2 family protein [Tsukamurella tyrosinosolvens]